MEGKLKAIDQNMTQQLQSIRKHVTDEICQVNIRVDEIQEKVAGVETMCSDLAIDNNKELEPVRSIVIKNLKEEQGKSTDMTVKDLLVTELGIDHTDIIRTKRLLSRTDRPGIIKAEFKTQEI